MQPKAKVSRLLITTIMAYKITQDIEDDNFLMMNGYIRNRMQFESFEEFGVYSLIHGFSQGKHGFFDGTKEYVANWIFSSERTVQRLLQNLINKGYIIAMERNGKPTIYQIIPGLWNIEKGVSECHPRQFVTPDNLSPHVGQNVTPSAPSPLQPPTREKNIKYITPTTRTCEIDCTDFKTAFEEWWKLYDRTEFGSNYQECLQTFAAMTLAEREQCISYTQEYIKHYPKENRKQPKWFFKNQQWKDDISTLYVTANMESIFLDGTQQQYCLKRGEDLVQVQVETEEGTRYKIVRKADAAKYNLKITKEWKR